MLLFIIGLLQKAHLCFVAVGLHQTNLLLELEQQCWHCLQKDHQSIRVDSELLQINLLQWMVVLVVLLLLQITLQLKQVMLRLHISYSIALEVRKCSSLVQRDQRL